MDNLFIRNRFYVSDADQKKLREFKIFLAGCGIGSNIAECALRLGFEKQTLIDGDLVEDTDISYLKCIHY
ncbi:MAG: ThiF family adenylyltransferase [Niabella sp.]